MKTDVKNFPRGLDEKDLLYLIWKALLGLQGNSSEGGSDSSEGGSDSEGGSGCECLAPMVVEGTMLAQDEGPFLFSPAEGAPSWADAQAHMFQGGLVYLIITEDGEPVTANLASIADEQGILALAGPGSEETIVWLNPEFSPEGSGGGEGGDGENTEPVG